MEQAVATARERGVHAVLDVVASETAADLSERLGRQLLAAVDQRWSPDQKVTVRCYAAPTQRP